MKGLTISLLAAAQALPLPALGADSDEGETWHQVEMIVFSQQDNYGDEEFRRDLVLDYPENHIHLADPAQPMAAVAENPDELWDRPDRQPGADVLGAGGDARPETPVGADAYRPLGERPYMLLPREEHRLNPDAYSLNSTGVYKVLYHEAWRQPRLDYRRSPWVLVQGGDSYGEHHSLEGSVQVYSSRYIHFRTNLWLAQFGAASFPSGETTDENRGREWPELPDFPPQYRPQQSSPQQSHGLSPLLEQDGLAPGFTFEMPDYDYPIGEIVALKDSVRLQYNQLHYLDHPKMGVLVLVTEYRLPLPDEPEITSPPAPAPEPEASADKAAATDTVADQ